MKKSMMLMAVLVFPVTLLALPVKNITDHCFCDLTGSVPQCSGEEHSMAVQFATGSDGSEMDNCVFNSASVPAGGNGSADYVSCETESAIIEWKVAGSSDPIGFISAESDGNASNLDVIAVQADIQDGKKVLMPLPLNADWVVDQSNSCHLTLPSSAAIKALL